MTLLAELRALCDEYPVTYIIMMLCGAVCIVPSLLLLYAVLKSSIHSNCRILMCLWITAQLLVCATVCWLSVNSMILEERYFKDTFDANCVDAYILTWYIPIWITTTCFELGISLERGLSLRKPSKYHGSSASLAAISVYFILSVVFSFQCAHFGNGLFIWHTLYAGSETIEAALGTIFSNLLDIVAFSEMIVAGGIMGNIQIREGYLIARAMMPVYCMSSALKVVIIAVNWMYVTSILPHTVTQVMYLSLSEISCGLTASMFLLHHTLLRTKLDGILGRSTKVSPIVDSSQEATADCYFKALADSWNR